MNGEGREKEGRGAPAPRGACNSWKPYGQADIRLFVTAASHVGSLTPYTAVSIHHRFKALKEQTPCVMGC